MSFWLKLAGAVAVAWVLLDARSDAAMQRRQREREAQAANRATWERAGFRAVPP